MNEKIIVFITKFPSLLLTTVKAALYNVNVISWLMRSHIKEKVTGYCYHFVNNITYGLAQSDHIKRLTTYYLIRVDDCLLRKWVSSLIGKNDEVFLRRNSVDFVWVAIQFIPFYGSMPENGFNLVFSPRRQNFSTFSRKRCHVQFMDAVFFRIVVHFIEVLIVVWSTIMSFSKMHHNLEKACVNGKWQRVLTS